MMEKHSLRANNVTWWWCYYGNEGHIDGRKKVKILWVLNATMQPSDDDAWWFSDDDREHWTDNDF